MGYPAPDSTDDLLDWHLSQFVFEEDGRLGKSPFKTGGRDQILLNVRVQRKGEQVQEKAIPKIDIVPKVQDKVVTRNKFEARSKKSLKG